MNNVAKLLRGNLITSTVMTVILSAPDAKRLFEGKISGKQMFKNLSVTVSSLAGGMGGMALGSYILGLIVSAPGAPIAIVVSLAGATVGGTAMGEGTRKVVGKFFEDDAIEMVRIINNKFSQLVIEYALSEDEGVIIVDELQRELSGETLLNMFASIDREAFAEEMLRYKIERLIKGRARVYLPNEEEYIYGIKKLINDCENEKGLFDNTTNKRPSHQMTKSQAEDKIAESSIRKGMYSVKQMNLIQAQSEILLNRERIIESRFSQELNNIKRDRKNIKDELDGLLGGKYYEQ